MPRFTSSKRPAALKDIDYDHEISLIDHTTTTTTLSPISPVRTRSQSVSDGEHSRHDLLAPEPLDTRRHSDDELRRKGTRATLREELVRRKYGKYSTIETQQPATEPPPSVQPAVRGANANDETRPISSTSLKQPARGADRDSSIDILYENERGGFLCGMPLFSSKALGAADAPPWTNVAQKASATNIKNAQVPDPSWEWAWKEWSVNHDDEVDPDGWEYSFMYAKCCSWHGPHWYNSFVRRRAWIRKRVRKSGHRHRISEAHRLNSDYFTIHTTRSRSPSKAPSMVESRISMSNHDADPPVEREDLRDIGALMAALKACRIDREKTEAVENFIMNAGDDLVYLSERMHDIMAQFIFQASRRSLLAHLTTLFEEASSNLQNQDKDTESDASNLPDGLVEVKIEGKPDRDDADREQKEAKRRRVANLEKGYRAADQAVKTLEYWSDIKHMAKQGETKGAVDDNQGWDADRWAGVDNSGPQNVISDPVVRKGDEELDVAPGDDGEAQNRRVSFVETRAVENPDLPSAERKAAQQEADDGGKGKGKERA